MERPSGTKKGQIRALLFRNLHVQKREHCDNFCNFIVPSLALVILTVLASSIKGRETIAENFEKKPLGGFVARPFSPLACARGVRSPEAAAKKCRENPFPLKYTVPVSSAKQQFWNDIGSRNATEQRNSANTGLLAGLSLEPYVYPPALPGSGWPFARTQTSYDGVFLHSFFNGKRSNSLYRLIVAGLRSPGQVDRQFGVSTKKVPAAAESSSRDQLLKLLFGSWFNGSSVSKYYGAFHFEKVSVEAGRAEISAQVFYNGSRSQDCTRACQLFSNVVRLENSIYKAVSGKSANVYLRKMPVIDSVQEVPIIRLIVSILLGTTFHFLLPSYLRFLVMERQARVRDLMSMMGLASVRYWLGSYLGFFAHYCLVTLLVILVGVAARVPFFYLNTPVSYLVLFFLWGHTLIAFSMALAPFFKRSDTALIVGWLYVILVSSVGGPYLGSRLSVETSESTWRAIMLLPSFAFYRSLYYAGGLNAGGRGVTLTSEFYNGTQLGMCHGSGPFCTTYVFLFLQWIFLALLGLYLDRVLPGAVGGRLHPLFFVGFKRGSRKGYEEFSHGRPEDKDDVRLEKDKASELAENMREVPYEGLVVDNLEKTFTTSKPPVRAIAGISFVARRGEVMGILGHNGAGKTTTFKMLVGEITPSSGDAFVNGHSIDTDMQMVHSNMGVCPQENILWPSMTVEEHLSFFGRVKGLSGATLKEAVDKSLASVHLTDARKRRVDKCSGGMKRRLAVAIAMVGNPRFVLLDEPSTGLDILTREKLWTAVRNCKVDNTVLLTTHSLEEAESLCDRVAILSRGNLMCIGKPEELKMRLGEGYHLNVSLPETKVGELHSLIRGLSLEARIDTQLSGNVEYVLPKSVPISAVFAFVARYRAELRITDWAVNQSTLEDVFLSVTKPMDIARSDGNADVEEGSALV